MSRCSRTALAWTLSLCLLPALASAEIDPAFSNALQTAAEQLAEGDSLGANILYERLLADPRLDTLTTDARSEVWAHAAVAAGVQNDGTLAEQRVKRALEIKPDYAYARLLLAGHQLSFNQLDAAADNMIRGIRDSEDMPELPEEDVWHISNHLRTDPARRLALLQGLFDHQWKPNGMEPTWQWLNLAVLQVEAGQGERVAATLERVDEPVPLVQLRGDKRFDPYIKRDDPRFDPVASAQRHIDRLRVETMLSPGLNDAAVALADALLVSGQPEETLGMTETLGRIASTAATLPEGDEARTVGTMLNARSRAFWQLGRSDEAIQTQELATRMAAADDDAEQKLRLAVGYLALHRPALARQAVKDLGGMTGHGEAIVQLIQLHAALQLNDAKALQQAHDGLAAVRKAAPTYTMMGLVADNRLDDAAALLAERLADPEERGLALLEVQDLRHWPLLPAEEEFFARWTRFTARADVLAAVNKVGRIERYPLFAE